MRVLLVDDSEVQRRAVAAMLADAGLAVETACNGREAMHKLAAGHHDVVVLDIVMPEMDGFETMRAIRAIDPALRIVAMTSRVAGQGPTGAVDYLKFASALGAHAVLRKPFRRADLLAAIGVPEPEAPGPEP